MVKSIVTAKDYWQGVPRGCARAQSKPAKRANSGPFDVPHKSYKGRVHIDAASQQFSFAALHVTTTTDPTDYNNGAGCVPSSL